MDAREHGKLGHPHWCHCWGTSLSPTRAPLPALSPMQAGTVSSTLSHPWDNTGKACQVWLGDGPPSLLQESPQAAQGALAGGQGWCQPHGSPAEHSQQIHLRSSPSTTLLTSHLPCALAPTLVLPHPCPQSLTHSACKEGDGTLPN